MASDVVTLIEQANISMENCRLHLNQFHLLLKHDMWDKAEDARAATVVYYEAHLDLMFEAARKLCNKS